MRFNLLANSFVEEKGVESHTYEEVGVKPPRNVELQLNLFNEKEFGHISGVIVNNNAISEELQKDYCCLLLNPFAKLPIDETKLNGVKYFLLSAVDQQYVTYRWVNP